MYGTEMQIQSAVWYCVHLIQIERVGSLLWSGPEIPPEIIGMSPYFFCATVVLIDMAVSCSLQESQLQKTAEARRPSPIPAALQHSES